MMTGTKSRLFVLSALAATVVALPASDARADEIAPCDLTIAPYKCAKIATASPFTKTLGEDAGFSNDLTTGWIPKDAAPDGHGDKLIQVKAEANLKDTKVTVALASDWVLRWGPDAAGLAPGSVRLGPRKKAPGGGDMKVTYKLYPNLGVYVGISQFKGEFNFDPIDILKLLPETESVKIGQFDYSASCSKQFSLWSYGAPSEACQVKDDTADGGTLIEFSPLTALGKQGMTAKEFVDFAVTLRAGTNAGFTWQTNKIVVDGSQTAFDAKTDYVDIPYDGSAVVAVTAQAKGLVAYEGTTYITPAVKLKEIAGVQVNLTLDVGVAKFDVPFKKTLPETTIQQVLRFPVPNLKATVTPVNFGSLEIDPAAKLPTKQIKVKLANLGEGISKATVSSSNQAIFKIVKKDIEVAGSGEGEIDVEFAPTDAGDFTGEITVVSNNIDGVDQKIPVKGSASLKKIDEPAPTGGKAGSAGKKPEPEPEPEPEGGSGGAGGKKSTPKPAAEDDATTSDGGCGCRVPTSSPTEQAPAAALALFGLAALAFRRRK